MKKDEYRRRPRRKGEAGEEKEDEEPVAKKHKTDEEEVPMLQAPRPVRDAAKTSELLARLASSGAGTAVGLGSMLNPNFAQPPTTNNFPPPNPNFIPYGVDPVLAFGGYRVGSVPLDLQGMLRASAQLPPK